MQIIDPNMDTALRWAKELRSIPTLPSSLQDVSQRAKLVRDINTESFAGALLADYYRTLSVDEKVQCLNEIARGSKTYISDVDDDGVRKNLSLRLWSGCLSAAKIIALRTNDGPNTPDKRASSFRDKIDPQAQMDPIYRAGVEAAPHFKKLLEEEYSFEGVPEDSTVRRYPSVAL